MNYRVVFSPEAIDADPSKARQLEDARKRLHARAAALIDKTGSDLSPSGMVSVEE